MTPHVDSYNKSERQEEEARLRQRVHTLEQLVQRQKETINLFYTLFYASPIPLCISRFEDGRFLYVNDAYLRYFGWEREEIVGRTGLEMGFWRDEEERRAFVERLRQQGQLTLEGSLTPEQSKKGPRHAFSSISYVETERDAYVITVHIDLTEQVVAENQVEKLAAALLTAEHQERKRVAQLLHDDIQQLLYSVQLDLQSMVGEAEGEMHATLQDMEQRMSQAIDAARTLSFELNAVALESKQLQDMLDWLTLIKAKKYGLELDVQQAQPIVIEDRARRQVLLKVLRELLFNVAKHAGVKQVRVTAEVRQGILHVTVIDEGVGFDLEDVNGSGADAASSGLGSVDERLRSFGGALVIESAPGMGTRCEVILPLA